MKSKEVVVVPYDPKWKHEYEKIKIYLEKILKDSIIAIEHTGSTGVEGLSAKPIIDIDGYIEVKSPWINEIYKKIRLAK